MFAPGKGWKLLGKFAALLWGLIPAPSTSCREKGRSAWVESDLGTKEWVDDWEGGRGSAQGYLLLISIKLGVNYKTIVEGINTNSFMIPKDS